MKLSVVVPCYNEGENVLKVLAAYNDIITRDDVEVILVNNGSTDTTAQNLSNNYQRYQHFLRIITIPKNLGYGHGILEGLREARGEFIGWTHGDLQTPPQDILRALKIVEQHQDATNLYIKGSRTGRPLLDIFFTTAMSLFETLYLRANLFDINAQPNIFHKSFLATWSNPPNDFSLDLYALYMARQQKLTVIRFKVPFLKREHGISTWNYSLLGKWKFIKRTFLFSLKLKKHLP